MADGLFSVRCPHCGADLVVDAAAHSSCDVCGANYLMRFGHLIPTLPTAPTLLTLPSRTPAKPHW